MTYLKLIGWHALVIPLFGLGCVQHSLSPSTPSECTYKQSLDRINHSNYDPLLSDVERDLRIGNPVDFRSPSFLDPYWWFTYLKNDTKIELAAVPVRIEDPPTCEICDRSQFRYCPRLYWIGKAEEKSGHRLDENGAARRTYRIRLTIDAATDSRISTFLAAVDMTRILRIDEIESKLQLGAPCATGAASSTLPMISLEYVKDGYIVELFASELDSQDKDDLQSWADDRSRLAFTGYWTASKIGK
ncbi:MAG TPA: hypothetical protein VJZ71_09780 [Phycisphaerae bacterium]|nr:hypothetical protein [Phycisphaerae bacterium]